MFCRSLPALAILAALLAPASAATPARAAAAMRVPALPKAQGEAGICCCRYYARGWQHAWMAPAACAQAGGACVSPDQC
jgi:hypothetical protein